MVYAVEDVLRWHDTNMPRFIMDPFRNSSNIKSIISITRESVVLVLLMGGLP
jgi:hypothetical protein